MTTRVHTVAPETKVPECITLMHREPDPPSSRGERRQRARVLSVRDLMGSLIERHERLLRGCTTSA